MTITRTYTTLCCLVLVAMQPFVALAVGSQFTVQQQVIDVDNDAPSVPQNLSATAVATTQINLSWDASTDNVAVSGYQVFRDGTQVATSTATSYADTGLSADTPYTYIVTAFDVAGNVSASSTPASATTPAESVEPEESVADEDTGGVSGGSVLPRVTSLSIVPATDQAVIRWTTDILTRSVLRWGVTASYELGAVAERAYATEHTTTLTGLTPGTVYEFVIRGETPSGREALLARSTFETHPGPDVTPPANVWNFTATRDGDDVALSWELPDDPDVDEVRIVRTPNFFPSDPHDGVPVYRGDGFAHTDRGAALGGGTRYYAAFVYDAAGNISSGALVRVVIDGDDTFPAPPAVDAGLISFADIVFAQDDVTLRPRSGRIVVDASRTLTAAIPYEALPEHLKTVTVTLSNPDNPEQIFTFLLRINDTKTAYVATLAPLGRTGSYPVSVSIFDFKRQNLSTAYGAIDAYLPAVTGEDWSPAMWLLLLFTNVTWLLVVLVLVVRYRRRARGVESGTNEGAAASPPRHANAT